MRWSALIPGVVFLLAHHAFVTSQAPEPGYLDFDNLPETNFSCQGKVIGGYYADVETGCQMFHVCTIGQKGEVSDIKFLCLNGTVFDQETRVCERLDEVDCSKTEAFYDLNLELYGNNPAVGSHSDDDSDDDDESNKDEREEASTESNEEPATPSVPPSVAPSVVPVSPATTPPPTTTGSLPLTTTTSSTQGPPAVSNFPNALNALLALHNALHQNGHQATTASPRPGTQSTAVPHNILLSQLSSGHHFPAVESHRQKQQQELQEQLLREQLQFQKHHQQLQQHQLHQQKQQQQQQVMQQRQQQQQQRQQQQQQHQQQQDLLKETQQKVRTGSSTLSPPQAHSHVTHLTSHHVQNLQRPYSHHLASTSRPSLAFAPVVSPPASPPNSPRLKPVAIPFRPFHPASSSPSGPVPSSTTPVPDPSSFLLHQVRVPSAASAAVHPPRPSSSYFLVRDDEDDQIEKAFSTTINHPTSKPGGGASGPPARSSFSFKPLSYSTAPPQPPVGVSSHVSSVTRSVSSSSSAANAAPKKPPVIPTNKSAQQLASSLPKQQEFIRRFNPDAPVSPATTSVGETGPDAEAEADAYEYDDEGGAEDDDEAYFGDVTRVVDKQHHREKRDLGTLADVESVPGINVDPSAPRLLPQQQAGRRRASRVHNEQSVPAEAQRRRPAQRGPGRNANDPDPSPIPADAALRDSPETSEEAPRRRPSHTQPRQRSRGGQRYSFMEDPLIARKAAAAAEAAEPSTTTTPAPLPDTNFSCNDKVAGGFYADTEADCQLFHICSQAGTDGRLTDNKFLCGPGTRFNQRSRTCQARDLVDCRLSTRYYNLNAHFKIPPPEEEIPVPTFDAHRLSRQKRTTSKKTFGTEDEASFECTSAGLFADVASGCERFHLCESKGSSPLSSFRCPGDQLFNQRLGACDAADLVDCALLSRPEHEFRRDQGHTRRRRSTPILVSVNAQPKDSVRFYYADYEDAVPVYIRRPQRQPKSTKTPLYQEYDDEENVASTQPPPSPAKSVSYYVYSAKEDAQTVTATRPPNSAVPEDYVDDNYEAQSHPQTSAPSNEKLITAFKTLMDFVDDYDDLANRLTKPTTRGDVSLTTSPSPADKPVAIKVLDEYDYVANDYDDTTKGDFSPKDKSDVAGPRPFSQIDTPNVNNTEPTTNTVSTTIAFTIASTTDAPTTQAKPYRRRIPSRRRPSLPHNTHYRSRPTSLPTDTSPDNAIITEHVDVSLTSTSITPLPELPSTVSLAPEISDSSPSPSPPSPTSITTLTEPLTTTNVETVTSRVPLLTVSPVPVPVGPFVCTGREMNKFHRDNNNCRMFHYCTAGFTARQVLDFRFECVDGTSYDELANRCQVPVSGPCAS